MKKIIFTVFILIFAISGIMAQKKKKKAKEEEMIEIDIEVTEEVLFEEESYSSDKPIELLDNIRYNKKYEIYGKINDDFDWYYKRYSKNKLYGIVNKSGDVILPDLYYQAV
ncbi:MAG: hypothetical protein KTR26_06190 [Flammeovirgaceae bacterium]|nr:hypothetical protein [Flammeovirgaceae bacterium]